MKVSILIPFYNAERHLATTIRSALSQTYQNKEVILVDDGSTDSSLSIAKSFSSRNVLVISQSNAGACSARNAAFDACGGDIIQYLDADDLLSPSKISNQVEILRREPYVVVSSRFVRFCDASKLPSPPFNKGVLDRDWDHPIDWLINEWTGKGMGQTATWLTPRNLIAEAGRWDETISINQDGEFFCRVLLRSPSIRFCDDAIVYYRSGNNGSVSQQITYKKAASLLLSYKLYEQHISKSEWSERVRHALAAKYRSFVYSFYDQYSDLVEEAERCYDQLGIEKNVLTGGKNFRSLTKIIGFNNSLMLRSLVRKMAK